MMIGALKPPLRRLRTTSRPSVSGKPTSISTRSGELALAALAPLAPVSTAEASNSSCSDNCSTSVSRRSLSSSTIRILRALGIGYDPLEAGGGHRGSVKPGRQVLIRIEVSDCYRFTSRAAVYPKFEARLDECPVMASLGRVLTGDNPRIRTLVWKATLFQSLIRQPRVISRLRPFGSAGRLATRAGAG